MRMTDSFVGILTGLLVMGFGLANGPARGYARQGQSAPAADSKKPASTQKKSNRRELSEDQGGARGFALPGDEGDSKPKAKSTKAGSKKTGKTAPDHSPKRQP